SGSKIVLPQMPWLFVVLPGIIGITNHIVTRRQRGAEPVAAAESIHLPKLREAFAAAMLLTGVFAILANATHYENLSGLVYAGYGAYVSTLWFMLVRLNANALSPRFLVNSALKASIAMFIGYMASATDVLPRLGIVVSL